MTLKKAMKIVNENNAFYYKDEIVNGKTYRIFNYRLASYEDFKNKDALELRGLTIRLDDEKIFYGLHKFFNDKENPYTMDDTNWNVELECREKLDGSLIHCVIDDKIFAKTKGTFNSPQAQEAQKIFDKYENYQKFILDMHDNGYYVFFEYISPLNQIVVNYDKSEFKLIQIRDFSGNYLCYNEFEKIAKKYDIPHVQVEYKTLDELRKLQETIEGIEGWVIRNSFEPLEKQFRKFKTKWYFTLHHLISPDNLAENKLIEHTLNETIDDVISQITNQEKKEKIEEIRNKVSHYFDSMYNELCEILKEKENMERKEFAIKYKNHPYFGVLVGSDENTLYENLKNMILKRTNKLQKAREFLNQIIIK